MTPATRTQLAEQALEKSLEVREEYGYDFRSPLSACGKTQRRTETGQAPG